MKKKVLIVGLGLLGGSYALALGKKGYEVTAIDNQEASIAYALEQKMISKGSCQVDPLLLSEAELVVLALYPSSILDWVKEHQGHFTSGTILTDVCGVKGALVSGMETVLREDLFYVGAHPMAGKEVSGVAYADEKIFQKANFILTPTPKTDLAALSVVETMAEDMGFRQISQLSPQEHDKAIGFLSQLTHVIAVSLMNCQDNEEYIKYTGDSFRDLTRIAKINQHLWSELFLENKSMLLGEIENFIEELQGFRELLASENLSAMEEKFVTSTNRRKKYDNF
ncbi:MAG: prephenate dehydrogenase [Eubacteriales bacterium]